MDAKAGAHQWNLTNRQMSKQYFVRLSFLSYNQLLTVAQYYNISDMMYSPAVGFTKISILLLVLRIFCPGKRDPYYWVLQSLNILNTVFYAVYFIIPFVLCDPRKKIWLPQTPGKCLQVFDLYIASATFNVLSDVAMYSAPLWKIWHLQLSSSRKLGMSAVFATGGL